MKKIKLTQGKFAIIDDEDFELVSKYKWHYLSTHNNNGYAVHNIYDKKRFEKTGIKRNKHIMMHNFIMQTPKGMITDHINGNGLNNIKNNLRICTRKENSRNRIGNKGSSQYKGIIKRWSKFSVRIIKNGKTYYSSGFDTLEEAALEYNRMAKELHGEFAKLNKI